MDSFLNSNTAGRYGMSNDASRSNNGAFPIVTPGSRTQRLQSTHDPHNFYRQCISSKTFPYLLFPFRHKTFRGKTDAKPYKLNIDAINTWLPM